MGYEIPETYEDMVALSEQIVADGMTPWCFGFESGGATGWPGTDWLEDIYVRQSGADMLQPVVRARDPLQRSVRRAGVRHLRRDLHGEGFVLGGTDGVAGINVDDTPGPLFRIQRPAAS